MIIKVILPFIFCSSWIKDRLKQKFPSANTLRPSLQFNPSVQVRLVSILPLTEWSSGSNLPGKFWSLEYRDLNLSDCLCSDRLHTITVHCISACVLSILHVFHQPLRALSTDLRQVSAIHFLALSFEYSDRFTNLSSPKRKIKKIPRQNPADGITQMFWAAQWRSFHFPTDCNRSAGSGILGGKELLQIQFCFLPKLPLQIM